MRYAHCARTVVEIGVAEGASAAGLHEAMPKDGTLYLIDPFHLSRLPALNFLKRAAKRAVCAAGSARTVWVQDFSHVAAMVTIAKLRLSETGATGRGLSSRMESLHSTMRGNFQGAGQRRRMGRCLSSIVPSEKEEHQVGEFSMKLTLWYLSRANLCCDRNIRFLARLCKPTVRSQEIHWADAPMSVLELQS
jgi:hypothetical protein